VTRTRPEITFDKLDPIQTGTVGQPFTLDVRARTTGGDKPCNKPLHKFTMTGAEASGLSINADTGLVSGTPTVDGNYDVTFGVSDSNCPAYEAEPVTGKIVINKAAPKQKPPKHHHH
jgi:hypothetical protein